MTFIKPYIVKIAHEFWTKTGQRNLPPFDITGAVNLVLPVDIISLSDLTIKRIEDWLTKRNIPVYIDANNRSLHGFILNFRGRGLIFLNGTDPEEERRYTIAHEASHFILDYMQPRKKAIEKFGPNIQEVLDGQRSPTIQERIHGLLLNVTVEPVMHLLEKNGDGSFSSINTFNSENDADALALELLAPSSLVIKEILSLKGKLSFHEFEIYCNRILIEKYQLPTSVIKPYSVLLAYTATGGPSILDKLGLNC